MAQHRAFSFLAITLALGGCPADDDEEETGADTDGATETGTASASATDSMTMSASVTETDGMTSADTTGGDPVDPAMCPGAGGDAAAGDPCTSNGDCESGVCTIFTDVPINDDAVCGEFVTTTALGCNTRITGTVFDFATGMPVADATVKVAGAVSAVGNPTGAMALAEATSGADGRIDVTTEMPVKQAIAIIALVESASGFLTATGLSAPIDDAMNYPVGNGIHDLWVVPTGPLGEWTTALEMDMDVPPDQLPLGEQGGVVGLVRDATGAPVAGAVVAPTDAESTALVRYVNADNTVSADMTTETGIFIVIGANQFGEDFEATMDGASLATGTAGATDNAVFTLILNVD
jgi:hypothetical protein